MMHRRRTTSTVVFATALACGLIAGTTGCTGSPVPHTASATPSPGTTSAAGLAKWLKHGGEMPKTKAIASAQGTIDNSADGTKLEAKAEVLSVTATKTTTELVWRLSTADGSTVDLNSSQMSQVPWNGTRLIGLEVPATKTTYHPYTMVPPRSADGRASECVCSDLEVLGLDATGRRMYASMPPLPSGVTTVTVTIPGFPDMTDVPARGR